MGRAKLILSLVLAFTLGSTTVTNSLNAADQARSPSSDSRSTAPPHVNGVGKAKPVVPTRPPEIQPTQTVMVPMRDGTRLATNVYLPPKGGPAFPVILVRTVYGRDQLWMVGDPTKAGVFAVVMQDTRGHGDSEGKRTGFASDGWGENQDGVDTVDWIKSQEWCNGKIGTWGASALGITQVLMAPATSSITCQAIFMAPSNFYHVYVPGGVMQKHLGERYAKMMGHEEVLKVYRRHRTHDTFWTYYNAEARAGDITAPAVHVSGWFDLYPQGAINNFVTRQYQGGKGAKANQKLIMGPWSHRISQTVGELTFRDSLKFDPNGYAWRFFRYWLQNEQNGIMNEPAVHYYIMGDTEDPNAPGNEWRTANDWPPYPTKETPYYLRKGSRLSLDKPTETTAKLTYTFDPANPCPTHGGTNAGIEGALPAGPFDQRVVSGRKDVLCFETEPLKEQVEVTGAVRVKLYISSDAPDTDFTAKLVDIYPDGRQIGMTDGIQRVKFRNSFGKPDLLPPGKVGVLEIDLWSISLIFNKGHKIGVLVSSSNWPRCEVNPNTGEDLPRYTGVSEEGDWLIDNTSLRTAHNTVYMDKEHPSALILPVRAQPENQ